MNILFKDKAVLERIVLKHSLVAYAYEKIENTTKRFEMTDHLVDHLKNTPKDTIDCARMN